MAFDAPATPSARLTPPWTPRRVALGVTAIGFLVSLVWAWRSIGFGLGVLSAGAGDVLALLERMLPPRFADLPHTIDLAIETLFIAVLGTFLATAMSVPLAFLAARNTTPNAATYGLARGVIVATRTVPDLVFALVFRTALGIGVLPGVLAIGLHSIGMVAKLYADAIEQTDESRREAVLSTGATRLQAITTSVVPQALPSFIGVALYRLDINVRISVVLGFVGAGGIGFELQATLRQLAYEQAMGLVVVIALMVVLMEVLSAAMRRALIGNESAVLGVAAGTRDATLPRRTAASAFDRDRLSPPWTAERRIRAAYGALIATAVVYACWSVRINPLEIFTAWSAIWEEVSAFFPPDFNTARGDIVEGLSQTVAIAVVSTFLGTLLSLPLGLLAARNVSPNRLVYWATRGFLVIVRAIPELVLAILFVAAIGLGPVPGTLALTVGTLGFLAKLVADAVEEIDAGPREAVVATGATRLQETAASVVPQAFPAFVSSVLYMLDINIRASTILGIVGGGGIGFLLFNSLRVRAFETTGAILIAIFVIVYAIERFSGWVRKQLL